MNIYNVKTIVTVKDDDRKKYSMESMKKTGFTEDRWAENFL